MQSALGERRVIERYRMKTRKSEELFQRAKAISPGGVTAGIKHFDPYPLFMSRGAGDRVWDVDGNEYIDYLMSFGALILGHGHPVVRDAIESVLEQVGTTATGTPTRAEVEYGTMLRDTFHPDGMSRFTNSGLEATLLAVRLAKAFTGRSKVGKFEGHYHGAVDHLLFSYSPRADAFGPAAAPLPVSDSADVDAEMLKDSVVLPFNDWENTERLILSHAKDLACIIMEPFEDGVIPGDASFVKSLRNLTADLGVPLIFDEVKTGFRLRLGGAGEFYSVVPDITCLGKIIGGGLPIGAVVGAREVMEQLDPDAADGSRVFHSGTFNGNPLSLAVGMASVEELRRDGNFELVCRRTADLKRALSKEMTSRDMSHQVVGEGAMFNIYFGPREIRNYRDVAKSDHGFRKLLDMQLIVDGIYLKPGNRFCLSLDHSPEDIRVTGDRFASSLGALVGNAAA